MSPTLNLSFCACKTAWFAPEWQVYTGSSPHLCYFFMQISDFRTRLTSLYGSQTSTVVLSTQNRVLSTRIKRLHWLQPSRVVLCMQISDFRTWITRLYWSQPSSVFFACKTAWLAWEILVSICPRPHDWFFDVKQRLLDRHNKSLWVPNVTCHFVHANQRN